MKIEDGRPLFDVAGAEAAFRVLRVYSFYKGYPTQKAFWKYYLAVGQLCEIR